MVIQPPPARGESCRRREPLPNKSRQVYRPPAHGVRSMAHGLEKSQIASSLGAFAGRELELSKALTTLGRRVCKWLPSRVAQKVISSFTWTAARTATIARQRCTNFSAATKLSDNDVIQAGGREDGIFEG